MSYLHSMNLMKTARSLEIATTLTATTDKQELKSSLACVRLFDLEKRVRQTIRDRTLSMGHVT